MQDIALLPFALITPYEILHPVNFLVWPDSSRYPVQVFQQHVLSIYYTRPGALLHLHV